MRPAEQLPVDPRTVRADVAELLFVTPDELGEDDNLFDAGLDSVALLTLVEQWREKGADVAFVDLAENPTLAGFDRVLTAARPASGPPAPAQSPSGPPPGASGGSEPSDG
ncbi:phosphopantetheine-binding protein [Frankia sp. KB5]|uniref:phosphopantetheine-binding protein n=1 Tax=Frankia sp. KB5 TaxID=683318 RepID=UPI000A117C4A|nr:phosphopantetheine-binding protein [Frankia sp. KB5]ORT53523.1 hypothetical protein KBI5_06880 [Frankia sp. KB5]